MVNEDGVQLGPENIRAIRDMSTPFKNASDTRSFIGMGLNTEGSSRILLG